MGTYIDSCLLKQKALHAKCLFKALGYDFDSI